MIKVLVNQLFCFFEPFKSSAVNISRWNVSTSSLTALACLLESPHPLITSLIKQFGYLIYILPIQQFGYFMSQLPLPQTRNVFPFVNLFPIPKITPDSFDRGRRGPMKIWILHNWTTREAFSHLRRFINREKCESSTDTNSLTNINFRVLGKIHKVQNKIVHLSHHTEASICVHLSNQSSKMRLQSMICSNISKSRSQMFWRTVPLKMITKLTAFHFNVNKNRKLKIQTLSGQWPRKHSAHQLHDLSKFTNVKINLYLCRYIPRPSVRSVSAIASTGFGI